LRYKILFYFFPLDNQIDTCTGLEQSKLPNLITLEMRENRLITTKGISLSNLKNLFLVKYYIYNSLEKKILFFLFRQLII
jgi:hypothetical protein